MRGSVRSSSLPNVVLAPMKSNKKNNNNHNNNKKNKNKNKNKRPDSRTPEVMRQQLSPSPSTLQLTWTMIWGCSELSMAADGSLDATVPILEELGPRVFMLGFSEWLPLDSFTLVPLLPCANCVALRRNDPLLHEADANGTSAVEKLLLPRTVRTQSPQIIHVNETICMHRVCFIRYRG